MSLALSLFPPDLSCRTQGLAWSLLLFPGLSQAQHLGQPTSEEASGSSLLPHPLTHGHAVKIHSGYAPGSGHCLSSISLLQCPQIVQSPLPP